MRRNSIILNRRAVFIHIPDVVAPVGIPPEDVRDSVSIKISGCGLMSISHRPWFKIIDNARDKQ
jgi:hypothetical protein